MEGFEKIELGSPSPKTETPQAVQTPTQNSAIGSRLGRSSGFKKFVGLKKLGRFKSRRVVMGIGIFFVLLIILIIIPSILVYSSAKKTYAQVNLTMAALKNQDIEQAGKELQNTRKALEDTRGKLNLLILLRFIPGPNIYYNDARHLVSAGFHGLDAADIFIESVEPYADVLGLKGQGSFVGGTAEQRIQTAVATMDKVTPKIDEIADSLTFAKEEIDEVNPNHYPEFLAGGKVKEGMVSLRKIASDGTAFIDQARPLIKVLPSLLGQPNPKKYLVIFQNDKELRPTGGFITAYAIFRVDKGVITAEKSEDIYSLDDSISGKERAPEPILKYLPKVPVFNLRDSNLSADFQKSMEDFREIYDKARGAEDVDGIIALDTHALVAVMNVLGDIEVNGQTFTTKIDERCDCPQVIY